MCKFHIINCWIRSLSLGCAPTSFSFPPMILLCLSELFLLSFALACSLSLYFSLKLFQSCPSLFSLTCSAFSFVLKYLGLLEWLKQPDSFLSVGQLWVSLYFCWFPSPSFLFSFRSYPFLISLFHSFFITLNSLSILSWLMAFSKS